MDKTEKIQQISPVMDAVSPTFCLAKWHHTTLYLQSGETHSCYHPAPHAIPLDELKHNPSALHNTPHKKLERAEMLQGERPTGCQYCWNIEDLGQDYISDRHERNASIYTKERYEQITKGSWNQNVNPEYVEISFGNECNFKCGYCHPKHSSSYYKEIQDFGPYDMVKNHRNDIDWFNVYREEDNPYVKAFWDWWPELIQTLTILRITGGEPLLQQSTWRLLDELEKTPQPHLEININTNLGIKTILVDRLADKVNNLIEKKCIKTFKVFTSIDTWGRQAEYLRSGLDLKLWEKNLDTYLSKTNLPVTSMITFNALSVANFQSLLQKIIEWREKYNIQDQKIWQRIRFDTPYLKEPLQYDVNILPKDDFMPYMEENLAFIKKNLDNNDKTKYSTIEFEKFKRVVEYMRTTHYPDYKVLEGRRDFANWFREHDRRRNTNFEETFPEYKEFFQQCSSV